MTIFEFFSQVLLIAKANKLTVISSNLMSIILEMSMVVKFLIMSLMNIFSSILLLAIEYFLLWICCSLIEIEIVSEAWFNNNLHSEWMKWLSNSSKLYLRNIRSMTKFELWLLSEYLIGMGLVGYDSSNERESIMSISKLL